ncbi:molybdate ABC transporter substrate-binding protein [Ruegeria lacuscaerulensis]|uniref:molybdate ABC transporter substrate-binding protein n=1 Tax=Ruegeria lacuscaerulensis TaxID=55218 RepID=UPI002F25F7FA
MTVVLFCGSEQHPSSGRADQSSLRHGTAFFVRNFGRLDGVEVHRYLRAPCCLRYPRGDVDLTGGLGMILSHLRRALVTVFTFCVLMLTPMRAGADGVLVFAAASLKNALDEIAIQYEDATGQEVTVSYAASSVLARQIQQGAPADLFISANAEWMDVLQEGSLIAPGSRVDLLGNRLVLIGGPTVPGLNGFAVETDLLAALEDGHLAMALVDAVPAGIYGKAALTNLGLWDDVQGKVAQTDNVRAALALVAAGAVPLGVVYRSDATVEDRARVMATFPDDLHPPIIYPAALTAIAGSKAKAFLDHLQSPTAQAVFERQGFSLPGQ